jgi:hypothetical protein
MISNHIPRSERLRARILRLQYRWDETRRVSDHGESCRLCRRVDMYAGEDDPRDAEGHPHSRGCPAKGLPAEIRHYQGLLVRE